MAKNKKVGVNKVSSFFKKYFSSIQAKPLKNKLQLEKLCDKLISGRTKYGARVFNNVYQTARCPQQTFHSTIWRDNKINLEHLETVKKTTSILKEKKIPFYTFWLRSGSGSQTKLWQLIFTLKGVPLALTGSIMMEPVFKNPQASGLKINGIYFAAPELMEINKDQKTPLILFNVGKNRFANVWVGGSDYPGEIYKPICKAHNGWVYDLGGFEMHSSAYAADYLNKKGKKEKSLVIISGLSLHGKSTLSTSNGVEPGYFEGFTDKQEVDFYGIHDDYVAFLPLDKKKSRWEIFAYAAQGLFPACHGDPADNPLTSNNRAALYNVYLDKNNVPDFNKRINNSINQRAASPIDSLAVFRRGQRQLKDFDKLVIIILTKNNFCPSGIVFKNPVDFVWSYGGVVVQKTDAVIGDFPDIYYNFACTDFDVVPREKYLARIVKVLKNFSKPVTLAMLNTGAPGPEESMRVRDALVSGWYQGEMDKKLGVEVINYVPGVKKLYFPWKQGGYSYQKTVKEWKKQQQERKDFMANKKKGNCNPVILKRLIGKPSALV